MVPTEQTFETENDDGGSCQGSEAVASVELPVETPLKGTETVLVADGDHAMREATGQVLRGFGYTVLEASSALEAQRLIRAHREINLLLTDFSTLGPNGIELAHWFQSERQDTKVLITTGSLWELVNQIGDYEQIAVLLKPFDGPQLGRMLRLILV